MRYENDKDWGAAGDDSNEPDLTESHFYETKSKDLNEQSRFFDGSDWYDLGYNSKG